MNNLKSELIPNNYSNYSNPQYFSNESNQSRQQYSDPYNHNNNPVHNAAYGYNPYQQSQHISYEPPQPQAHVSSSSPAYHLQPTPSPSPKHCNKCGYVCQSAFQLIQHLNVAHPPMSAPHLLVFQPNQHFMFNQPNIIKHEDPTQSNILDLDSHKAIHTVFPEDEMRLSDNPNGRNPRSMSALLNSWSPLQQQTVQRQQQLQEHFEYQQEQERIFINAQGFVVSGVTTTTQENDRYGMNPLGQPSHAYRSFEHLPSAPNAPVTSSSQVSSNSSQAAPYTVHKSSNWKSNEARRPKKYKCAVCNSLFTTLGHLKRHYNTIVHKNAVKKSSGQTSPTASSINSHNHPDRDNPTKQDDCSKSRSSADEIRNEDNNTMPSQFEKLNAMPLLQQSNEPYHRQPGPNMAVNSLTTTGEIQVTNQNRLAEENQPLPSFAQLQAYRRGLIGYSNLGIANVESGFRATDYPSQDDYVIQYPPNHNNVNHEHGMLTMGSKEAIKLEEKVHITPDDKENTVSPQISSTVTTKSDVIKCRDCDKNFAKACYLTQHNTTYHSGDKPFKCTKCGKRFSCEMIFKEHFTKHAGDKPHKCDFCSKQFNHKTDLRRHMCLHTGQKPYACNTCGKGFIRKDHMMKHCETHLKKSNGKMAGLR